MTGHLTCPVCGHSAFLTASGLAFHFAHDHTPEALAGVLAEVVVIVKAATLPLPRVAPIPGPADAVQCGKKCYPTQRHALLGLLSTWAAAAVDPRRREQRAYECDRCHAWHLTSQPERTDA